MPDISILVDIADYYDISIPEIISGERKSEMMNEEERKIAKTMSDYAPVSCRIQYRTNAQTPMTLWSFISLKIFSFSVVA